MNFDSCRKQSPDNINIEKIKSILIRITSFTNAKIKIKWHLAK